MSEMQRYEGAIRAGMTMVHRDDAGGLAMPSLVYAGTEVTWSRDHWRPVRPADTDRKVWELFLPDGPLPDTGRKSLRHGQVWAWTWTAGLGVVYRLVVRYDGGVNHTILAASHPSIHRLGPSVICMQEEDPDDDHGAGTPPGPAPRDDRSGEREADLPGRRGRSSLDLGLVGTS